MKKTGLALLFALFMMLALYGCDIFYSAPEIADNEIVLKVQLNVNEDIGLLVLDYDSAEFSGSGGTSNADKSLIKHDDLLYLSMENRDNENLSEVKNLSLRFTIVTKYFTPNYDNDYPSEYTITLDEICFDAAFGRSYDITITGDKTNGYTAVFSN